ncbi:Inosose dehydratase [Crateriforma conspicua]|uniref:Inosose dehydratase n=1 Tax=Crateriforma conspicua TaxID=2527996 RepID=A0A5C6G0R3_9PLAN|nr:sugar phosphate isomerase/epimerase [Crateriforma conspicua]TWU66833.1 Inosose dehydratase [Crateriforma conspicua]
MGKVGIGLNLEAVRTSHKSFEWGVEFAADLGYEYIEPMVHWGRELLSEARYFHSVSMLDDPFRVRDMVEKHGLKLSALSSHSQASKPEIAVEYLKQAARFAKEAGAPIINTHEGHKQPWTTMEEDFVLIRYSLMEALKVCERRDIKIGFEMHQTYSLKPDLYDRCLNLVDSPNLGANFDTGNAYLGGEDPHEWIERIKDRVIHVHAKDISVEQSDAERGKVMGTAVGCACGEGVIDWKRIVKTCQSVPQDIVLSVECGTLDQAERSIEHLRSVISETKPVAV